MKICIIGTGGAGREAFESLEKILLAQGSDPAEMVCFMQTDAEDLCGGSVMGVPVISYDAFNPEIWHVIVAIGDPAIRRNVVEILPATTSFYTLIDSSAIVSKYARLGAGSVIAAGVIVTNNVQLGAHAQLNLKTTISHDTVAGDFFTTAPSVQVCGNCEIGDSVYLGAGVCVRQGVFVSDHVTVGMGGIVVKDIPAPGVYAGIPVKKIK